MKIEQQRDVRPRATLDVSTSVTRSISSTTSRSVSAGSISGSSSASAASASASSSSASASSTKYAAGSCATSTASWECVENNLNGCDCTCKTDKCLLPTFDPPGDPPGAICGTSTLWYSCSANGFSGCCSSNACHSDYCPDSTRVAPTSSPTPSNSGGGGGSHAGAIAGGIVGGIAGLLLLIGAFIYFRRRAKYHSVQPHSVASPGTPLSPSPGYAPYERAKEQPGYPPDPTKSPNMSYPHAYDQQEPVEIAGYSTDPVEVEGWEGTRHIQQIAPAELDNHRA